MSKYRKGSEYNHKLLAIIDVAKLLNFAITDLFPSQLKCHFTVIRRYSLFPSFYDKIQTYAVDDKSVRQCKNTSFKKEIFIS